eukprot:jgi/Picsp_1/4326/NSC_01834-R1_expressed protein [Chlorella variabilis]
MSKIGGEKEDSLQTSAVCIKDALETEDDAEDATDDEASAHVWMKKALKNTNMGVDIDEESIEVLEVARDVNNSDNAISENAKYCRTKELTSLDIHKAIKKLLPGNPGDTLRPYLPSKTKMAWNLDKQSLKGIKRKRQKHDQPLVS